MIAAALAMTRHCNATRPNRSGGADHGIRRHCAVRGTGHVNGLLAICYPIAAIEQV